MKHPRRRQLHTAALTVVLVLFSAGVSYGSLVESVPADAPQAVTATVATASEVTSQASSAVATTSTTTTQVTGTVDSAAGAVTGQAGNAAQATTDTSTGATSSATGAVRAAGGGAQAGSQGVTSVRGTTAYDASSGGRGGGGAGATATRPLNTVSDSAATATHRAGAAVDVAAQARNEHAVDAVASAGSVVLEVRDEAVAEICGMVTAFDAVAQSAAGALAIDATRFVLGAGGQLTGQESLAAGAAVCVAAEGMADADVDVDVEQRIVQVNVTSNVLTSACGVVTSVQGGVAAGSVEFVVNNARYVLANATGSAGAGDAIRLGADICVHGAATQHTNSYASLHDRTVIVDHGLDVGLATCGVVSAYEAATADTAGHIVLDAVRYVIAAGTKLSGQEAVTVGSRFCVKAQGSEHADGSVDLKNGELRVDAGATLTVTVCGVVEAFEAATADQVGSIVVDRVRYVIAAGGELTGQQTIVIGKKFCATPSYGGGGTRTPGSTETPGSWTKFPGGTRPLGSRHAVAGERVGPRSPGSQAGRSGDARDGFVLESFAGDKRKLPFTGLATGLVALLGIVGLAVGYRMRNRRADS